MNIRDLHYLVTLAQTGHFKKASELCFVSQPTLSLQIKKLENDLGISLIERGGRLIKPTTEGQVIIEKAKTIFKVIDKNSEASLVELKPITGRKHQLRKQLYLLGQPIFGDTKYKLSNSNKGINKNLMLHSYQIKFMVNDIKHTYTALLPDYFKKLLKAKRLNF